MAKFKGGDRIHLANWLRSAETLRYIEAWEMKHNPRFKGVEFDIFKKDAGTNTFRVSAGELIKAGARSLSVQKGRYGGTYGAIQVALHFANWLDAKFYLNLIDEYLDYLKDNFGEDASRWRFSRELAAENYGLQQAAKRAALPDHADQMSLRRAYADESDILNLALFNETAAEWRKRNPKKKGNMRDYKTPEELKALAQLEYLNAQYIKHGADPRTRLTLLTEEATRLLEFYSGHHIKRQLQKKRRKS
ncbi:MAG: KilA-N domain-containing protein [Bacteroidota bacterium]